MSMFTEVSCYTEENSRAARMQRYREHDQTYADLCKQYEDTFNKGRVDISWVEGKVTLSRGGEVIKEYTSFTYIYTRKSCGFTEKSPKWVDELAVELEIQWSDYLYFQKHMFGFLGKYLGVRPIKFVAMFNACMVKAFIPEHLRGIANEMCRKGSTRKYDFTMVGSLIKNKDTITTMLNDNLKHLVPIALAAGLEVDTPTPQNIKKMVGKSTWKKLTSFTKTRNLYIANLPLRHVAFHTDVPSSLLRDNIRYTNLIARGWIWTVLKLLNRRSYSLKKGKLAEWQ